MIDQDTLETQIRAALEHETRINLHRRPIDVTIVEDQALLLGEVEDIGAKRLAVELAGAVPGVRRVVDRLSVVPGERRGDGAIRDGVAALLLDRRELAGCTIRAASRGKLETMREAPADGTGEIRVIVENGVATLEGAVESLAHKRLAGALAWWAPGCRSVVNALEVEPAEEDNDDEVVGAVRLVLEIDPLVDENRVNVQVRGAEVTLQGAVPTEEERRRAERDAWAIDGVRRVVNRIEVRG